MARVTRNRAAGKCPCGREREEGKKSCQQCRLSRLATARKRRANGKGDKRRREMSPTEKAMRRAQAKVSYKRRIAWRQREEWKQKNRAKVFRCYQKRRQQGLPVYKAVKSSSSDDAPCFDVQSWYEKQEKVCQICGRTDRLCIDHCHTTGAVRGLLCSMCNAGIGHFADDIERLKRAILYLEKYRAVNSLQPAVSLQSELSTSGEQPISGETT